MKLLIFMTILSLQTPESCLLSSSLMRVAIFGTLDDPQCQAVSTELERLGADPVLIPASALEQHQPASVRDGVHYLGPAAFAGFRAAYVRMVPLASAPYVEQGSDLVLLEDWFVRYMQAREREAYYLAWLLAWQHEGVRLVNPPHAGSVLQSKPYQLHILRTLGARIPRT